MGKYIGVDYGFGSDPTCYTVMKSPSRLRKWLRRIGLDRSRWEYKVIDIRFEPPITGKAGQ